MRALPLPGLLCFVLVALAATAHGELAQDPPQPAGAEQAPARQSYAGRTTFSLLQEILEKRDAVWTVGVNWYLNEFLRVQANVIREQREEGGIVLPVLGRTWSRTFRVQFQL